MKRKSIILLISTFIAIVGILPRLAFIVGKEDKILSDLIIVSPGDTLFRFISIFTFCFVTLQFNTNWYLKINSKRTVVLLITGNILIITFWLLMFQFVDRYIYNYAEHSISLRGNNAGYFIFMIVLIISSRLIRLVQITQANRVEKEQLKRQVLSNELEALKSQLNPHFLFNSLNSLSLLVREDPKAAVKFINRLSFLYRYILQSQDQNLVSVKEELRVLESYIFLIKERYRENFSVSVAIEESMHQRRIPNLALQLLLENAVKHNEISSNKPLRVEVYNEANSIVVKNDLQERSGAVESTQKGLANLNARFELYKIGAIHITKTESHFLVKIPTI